MQSSYESNPVSYEDPKGGQYVDEEVQLRLGFIRKVYLILGAQLLLTAFVVQLIQAAGVEWAQENGGLLMVSIIASFVCIFALYCVKNNYPINLIVLGVFTLCESFLVGFITLFYDQAVVSQAVWTTALIFVGLTIYAFTTKTDFTTMHGVAFSLLLALVIISIFGMFSDSEFLHLAIAWFGVCLFSLYIIIDTQIIMKDLSLDDYVLGAIMLYLDIINLFLYLLKLFSR
ncbi:hypothetical protein P9112_006014 [Eukaryota sp. TZLM1-RC]